ncbi:hypothetical protein ACU4GD_14770 [Cupriavidus basilensis]
MVRRLGLPAAVERALLRRGDGMRKSIEASQVVDALLPALAREGCVGRAEGVSRAHSRARVVHLLDRIGVRPGPHPPLRGDLAYRATARRPFPRRPGGRGVPSPDRAGGARRRHGRCERRRDFTASRLVGPKRIGMIIDAYRVSGVTLPLRIAGRRPGGAGAARARR